MQIDIQMSRCRFILFKLTRSVLEELKSDRDLEAKCVLVRLNGLIHTNDRIALRSITSQMQLDNVIEGKVFGSFSENLAFLLSSLRSGNREKAKSVIFVLEEFDLFCSHHNQTLLYNLFDVSQSPQTPVLVFGKGRNEIAGAEIPLKNLLAGVTCRLDVTELLEKRVKSRFSHRQIFLFPGSASDPSRRLHSIRKTLSIENEDDCDVSITEKNRWNKNVRFLVESKTFSQLTERLFSMDNKHQTLKDILFLLVSKLNEENPTLTPDSFREELSNYEKDELVETLLDLTVLEICLLLSMKHHCEIYSNQPMNFEMIFTRFMKFVSANSNVHYVPKAVTMKAFEHLENLELVAPIGNSSKLQKQYQMYKLLVLPQQIMEGVKKYVGLPTEVVQWANSSLS